MSQNVTIEAYDRMISAVRTFQKNNLEIASELLKCADRTVAAMKNDTPSQELNALIQSIAKKMNSIDSRAGVLKKNLEEVRNALSQI